MDDYPIGLHLPRSVFLTLVEHTGEAFYSDRAQSILCEVINQWISSSRRTPGGLNNHQDGVQAELKGYQWKQVFLPYARHSMDARSTPESKTNTSFVMAQ